MSIQKLINCTIKSNSYKVTKICFFLQKNRGVKQWIKRKLKRGRNSAVSTYPAQPTVIFVLLSSKMENQLADILRITQLRQFYRYAEISPPSYSLETESRPNKIFRNQICADICSKFKRRSQGKSRGCAHKKIES